ncbi:N-hydroxyarylamine O-acetyltransferase [Pedobacter cryoconitis]|uniref:N-hydroxyarylamine O-acetyltransferase n=1 Tax=Pedobacter cryoconitis TaxID=188932 RepID=A0A7W9DWN8_9SPHI|nr:arylamine N-acetyltransferase [Pedobacter cryoconitis]MBB5634267.1 N-hydroxyarylamine O-acetyltransferase [Pedobacter cryoconitis]
MQVQEYLDRIKYKGEPAADLNSLQELMKAHLLNVPFENLDIHWKTWITLDEEKIYTKIVQHQRGGFCYELNGSFQQLLIQLGFDVQLIGAKVYHSDTKTYSPPTSHMALLVRLEQDTYLVDVGFGDFISEPFKINIESHSTGNHSSESYHTERCGKFRLTKPDAWYYLVEKYNEIQEVYLPEYIFSTAPLLLKDFSHSCYFQQLSPDSNFTKNKVCSLLTETGRKTITQGKFIVNSNGIKTEQPIADEDVFHVLLQKEFNINRQAIALL